MFPSAYHVSGTVLDTSHTLSGLILLITFSHSCIFEAEAGSERLHSLPKVTQLIRRERKALLGRVQRLTASERLRPNISTSRELMDWDGLFGKEITTPSHSIPPLSWPERVQPGSSQPGHPGPTNSLSQFPSPTKSSQKTLMGKLRTKVGPGQSASGGFQERCNPDLQPFPTWNSLPLPLPFARLRVW